MACRALRRLDFVPYGETLDGNQDRAAYYRAVEGFTLQRATAAIRAVWPDTKAAPPHIRKVPA